MFSNDLDQSLIFSAAFLMVIFTLPLLLAWLDEPHDLKGAVTSVVRRVRSRSNRDGGPEARL